MILRRSFVYWYDPAMPSELGQIGPITIRTYTLLLDLAVLIGLGVFTWEGWRLDDEPGKWLDAGLWALVTGVIGGRLVHVAIHWQYFSVHMEGIPALWEGGLSWQGAILSGLAALMFVCVRRGINFRTVSLVLAFLLPVGAILTDIGCLASGCAHGREIFSLAGYPPYIAAELPDLFGIIAPRYQTQLFGVALNILLLLVALILVRVPRTAPVTFWIILALTGLGTFGIDFLRGDPVPMIGSLRLDQIFDLIVAITGLVGAIGGRPIPHSPPPQPRTGKKRIFRSLPEHPGSLENPGTGVADNPEHTRDG